MGGSFREPGALPVDGRGKAIEAGVQWCWPTILGTILGSSILAVLGDRLGAQSTVARYDCFVVYGPISEGLPPRVYPTDA